MDQPIDVSVSVVVYRDFETPKKMLVSLEEHTSPVLSKRVFVVDNSALASGDERVTEQGSFKEFLTELSDVVYLDAGANLGFGKANNVALMESKAEFHAFVNPDIVFLEDSLTQLVAYLRANQEVGMVIPRMIGEDGELLKVYRRDPTLLDALNRTVLGNKLRTREYFHTMQDMDYTKPFDLPFGQGSFLVGRTELLKELGGFDERYFMYLEDADLCRRLNKVSVLRYVPFTTVQHTWERSSHKNAKLFSEHIRSYARYFARWGI